MTELPQRIVESHKQAARRMRKHLANARGVALTPAEGLELLATAFGVANWQTLHGMALQGRGPRVADEENSLAVAAGARAFALSRGEVEARLPLYFADTGHEQDEHPAFTRYDWKDELEQTGEGERYWEYVARKIDEVNAMYPWERILDTDVRLASTVGWGVVHNYECESRKYHDWSVVDPYSKRPSISTVGSEKEAWHHAAVAAKVHLVATMRLPNTVTCTFTESDWLDIANEFNLRKKATQE